MLLRNLGIVNLQNNNTMLSKFSYKINKMLRNYDNSIYVQCRKGLILKHFNNIL